MLILLLPFSAAYEYCIEEDASMGYICYSDDPLAGAGGATAPICGSGNWCETEHVGASCLTQGSTPNQCRYGCCCDGDNTLYTGEKSYQTCLEQGGSPEPLGAGMADCVESCADTGSTGTGGSPQEVSGTVVDLGDNNAGLTGATISYPYQGSLRQVLSGSGGVFSIPAVDPGSQQLFAHLTGCGSDSKTLLIETEPLTGIQFELDCTTGGCDSDGVNDTLATSIKGEHRVDISWSTDCEETVAGFSVMRCEADGITGPCTTTPTPIGQLITDPYETAASDTTFEAQKYYCYNVRTHLTNGTTLLDDTGYSCVKPMWEMCMNGEVPPSGKCFNNKTGLLVPYKPESYRFFGGVFCENDNSIRVDAIDCTEQGAGDGDLGGLCVCTGNTYCRYERGLRQPECATPSDCAYCNGLFGAFVDPDAVDYTKAEANRKKCSESQDCIEGNYGHSFDIYESCRVIGSCKDYRNQESCEYGNDAAPTPYDRCGVSPNGCEWLPITGLEELNAGVCLEKGGDDNADIACELCVSMLGGLCSKSTCEQLGDCYYNTYIDDTIREDTVAAYENERCFPKSKMACRFYDSQQDCEDGSTIAVDVQYDDPTSIMAQTTGGTHARTAASNDVFGFGTCKWISSSYPAGGPGGYCVKNANMLNAPVSLVPEGPRLEDDCFEVYNKTFEVFGTACYADNTPPNTTVFLSEGEYVLSSRFYSDPPGIDYYAYDAEIDGYLAGEQPETYFCLAESGECVPDSALDTIGRDVQNNTAYTLYYYSVDPAGNLEEVKHVGITVVSDSTPHLTNVSILS